MSDETFHYTLAGRDILFRYPKAGQVLILHRIAQRATEERESSDKGGALTTFRDMVIKTLDLVESLIVKPEDREFVENELLSGNLEYEDVAGALGGPQEQPKPRKAAAKTSPKKAAPTKMVASRGRTKR